MPDQFEALPITSDAAEKPADDGKLNLTDVRNALTSLMWRNVGIRRDEAGLKEAEDQVNFWDRYVSSHVFNEPEGWELQNMLLVSRLMIAAARARHESRGVHYRSDYPDTQKTSEHIPIVTTFEEKL